MVRAPQRRHSRIPATGQAHRQGVAEAYHFRTLLLPPQSSAADMNSRSWLQTANGVFTQCVCKPPASLGPDTTAFPSRRALRLATNEPALNGYLLILGHSIRTLQMLVFPFLSLMVAFPSSAGTNAGAAASPGVLPTSLRLHADASLDLVFAATEVASISSLPFGVSEVVFFLALCWAAAVTALAVNVGWRAV